MEVKVKPRNSINYLHLLPTIKLELHARLKLFLSLKVRSPPSALPSNQADRAVIDLLFWQHQRRLAAKAMLAVQTVTVMRTRMKWMKKMERMSFRELRSRS
jgi:hypothetical protein